MSVKMEGPGIISRRGQDFLYPSRPALGHIQPDVQSVPGLFTGDKTAGRNTGADSYRAMIRMAFNNSRWKAANQLKD